MKDTFVELCRISVLKEGKGESFAIGMEDIAVFFIDGKYYAVSNICPHQHVPLISEGELNGVIVTCPMHGWSYNVATGEGVHGAGSIRTYKLAIEKGHLYIDIPDRSEETWW